MIRFELEIENKSRTFKNRCWNKSDSALQFLNEVKEKKIHKFIL